MERVLVVCDNVALTLYEKGLKKYSKDNTDISIDVYYLDYAKKFLGTFDKVKYKLNVGDFKRKYYDEKRRELIKLLRDYDTVLFFHLFYDDEYFIKSELIEALKSKKTIVYFIDSMKKLKPGIDFWDCFDRVCSLEYQDIEYAKKSFGIKVEYVPTGTNYDIYDADLNCQFKYDVCFVGIGTKKRLEYLESLAKFCQKKGYHCFVAGHFWHNNNWINYTIGKMKFRRKYPALAKIIMNKFIQPVELAKIYAESKICLNINVEYHKSFNPRNFDILYSKRLLISDEQNLQGVCLLPDRDFVMCDGVGDMLEKIEHYLSNGQAYSKMVENGRDIVEQRYLFKNTLAVLLGK